ncbi:hypothetical protein [Spiroplasma taiwanense]|uniref:Uncharacterized protein n=1 Tax=Spiroplasma taiwanense CT-1 TaxID=1276220 RepID=S5LW26_9MOLU|nr:hypothetical protein [Spiroplasma taiwanense]AGR40796.1 hypothetical protein STAIW_v1c01100 [Spiroplasma taiwanense CT-1]
MVNNSIIKVDQQKFENNEIFIQDINKKVIDIFSSNLRMWKLIENNLTLNPEDLKLDLQKIDSVATTSNQYMFKYFSLKLSFKDDEINFFNIVGKIYNYNFVPIEILNKDTFIELNKNIEKAQNKFISQEAFITIAFNGNEKQNIICTKENIGSQIGEEGCDWDGEQWVSINELKKDNLVFCQLD